ncbi:hypothetical protein KC19_2G041000 [Ceratodon purpureus]|uniref:F-box domain-containing protein n=1 Tax=Ceratodon purpureus TaxID=3225 RepID=A0A8T0IQ01_CERPU|nr:hypothetical protein KC19_2G041000 [Ceratodon purpureus]
MRKELPRKILYENMFARPPINVLCRFRLICKTWDRLIIQPEFVSLSTHVPQRELWILITPMMWEFLTPQREMENVGKYWTWRSYSTATLAVLLSLIIAIDIALSTYWL